MYDKLVGKMERNTKLTFSQKKKKLAKFVCIFKKNLSADFLLIHNLCVTTNKKVQVHGF